MKQPAEFRSIENIQANAEKIYSQADMVTVREEQVDDTHKMIYMVDPDGRGWYETKVLASGRWVTMEEAIFGRRIGKRRSA